MSRFLKNRESSKSISLKDFEIQDKLGEGSFGTCYKVRVKSTGEILVMKQINFST